MIRKHSEGMSREATSFKGPLQEECFDFGVSGGIKELEEDW